MDLFALGQAQFIILDTGAFYDAETGSFDLESACSLLPSICKYICAWIQLKEKSMMSLIIWNSFVTKLPKDHRLRKERWAEAPWILSPASLNLIRQIKQIELYLKGIWDMLNVKAAINGHENVHENVHVIEEETLGTGFYNHTYKNLIFSNFWEELIEMNKDQITGDFKGRHFWRFEL